MYANTRDSPRATLEREHDQVYLVRTNFRIEKVAFTTELISLTEICAHRTLYKYERGARRTTNGCRNISLIINKLLFCVSYDELSCFDVVNAARARAPAPAPAPPPGPSILKYPAAR
ncbi:hypothetical protein EVAR_7680_1 [Eumeta japonica]|uniref:Uncharacterized protein n=1 Tax=Eumeta variegata TaxID=151549 RepID=A0A4C1TI82_EUMVA|nr:hypothetical protein EVAR_7680_1 [Eumeta japonica]